MTKLIRVILADDHALVLEGLLGLLKKFPDIKVVATAEDGNELLDLLDQHKVDVVVLDLQMPYHGLEVLAEIRRRKLPVRALVLTAFDDGESVQRALSYEADGFALKTESPTQTVEAIRQVAQGRLVFPRSAKRWLGTQPDLVEEKSPLSPREFEVLGYVAQGQTNTEIAEELTISENTIRFHLKNIFEKLAVTNRTEAAAWYFNQRGPEFGAYSE